MTDRCEPPEELRGVDGWHWIVRDTTKLIALNWQPNRAGRDSEWGLGYFAPSAAYTAGYRYLSPVLTPAEADALRRERDEAQETAKKFQDAWDHATGERDALRADNKRLREALKAADQFITNGIELDFIRMPDTGTPDPAHDTPGIVRAALSHATPASGWLPIATAPRDGTEVLLWSRYRAHERVIGHWAVSRAPYRFEGWTTGWETSGGYDVGYAEITDPTHWQPLPEPPASAEDGE